MTDYDVVIIGGGAAGLSAALILGRARRRVLVIDGGEPRNGPAAHMHGYLTRDGQSPAEFLAAARAEVASYGVEIVAGQVSALSPGFTVHLADGAVVQARQLLAATGLSDQLADIAGVRENWGAGVVHCPYCHGYEVRDQALAVIATKPNAAEYAQLVRQWSSDVTFFSNGQDVAGPDRERLAARGITLVEGAVARVNALDGQVESVELADGMVVACQAVFAQSVMAANSGLFADLGCVTGDLGALVTDGQGQTTVRGVWAAGNVADVMAAVIHAAAAGSAVAMQLNVELVRVEAAAATG